MNGKKRKTNTSLHGQMLYKFPRRNNAVLWTLLCGIVDAVPLSPFILTSGGHDEHEDGRAKRSGRPVDGTSDDRSGRDGALHAKL